MAKYTELMLQYSDGELTVEQALLIEKELLEDQSLRQEYVLNQKIDEYMKGDLMINQIDLDTSLPETEMMAKNDIADYLIDKSGKNTGLAFYVNGVLQKNRALEKQVDEAEREIHLYNLENETKSWVNEWNEQKEQLFENDPSTQKILDFVKQGMKENHLQDQEIAKRKPITKLLYKIAAVAAIFIISFSLWILFSPAPTTDQLFAAYYQPYKIIDGQTRSNGENVDQLFKNAVKLYKNSEFEAAAIEFNKLLEIDNSSVKIRLLYGITQIELTRYEKAIAGFEYIIDANGDYIIEAKWYLSMCYVKTGEIKEAKLLLKELASTPGYYKNKARDLLKELPGDR